jgi:hypothetical protein
MENLLKPEKTAKQKCSNYRILAYLEEIRKLGGLD